MQRIAVLAGLVVAALAGIALAAAACGGSGAKPTATASPAAGSRTAAATQPPAGTPSPGSTIVIVGSPGATFTPSPVSDAQKTALAQGRAVPFSTYKDPTGLFTIGLPDGWTHQAGKNSVSATLAGSPATAQLGVYCAPNATVDALIRQDHSVELQVGEGDMPTTPTRTLKVAGVSASEIIWEGVNDGVLHKHWFVYLQTRGCAWRLLLTTLPGANVDDMLAVFQRMLDSFQPQ